LTTEKADRKLLAELFGFRLSRRQYRKFYRHWEREGKKTLRTLHKLKGLGYKIKPFEE
jgi:hypothetical protein